MATSWQNRLARVSRMDWEEVRVRLSQEFHKRSDLLIYRLGVGNGVGQQVNASAGRGSFFFSGNQSLDRAVLVGKNLPEEAGNIVREADEICGHRFRLLGYENLDYGSEIDWHLDRVHGKRAPLDPWFKIPFLDFAVVGDHKVTWELNRHQHLVTLAKARLLTRDEKYSRELMAQWRSWIEANPYPLGINWGSSLEVAFRSLSWIWVDQLLSASPECQEFRAELGPALAFHGRYIERYLSTYFSPNTHLIGEAVAMFFIGCLYPNFPRAANWKEASWKILVAEADRQVRPDGVYFEQSLYYHVYALDFFLHARLLASRNAIEVPQSYDAVLGRMLDVIAALAETGPAEGFGDDDGGRLFNPRRNRTENMTDPLALGAIMFSKDFRAARLTEEAIWLFGNQAVEKLSGPPSSTATLAAADTDPRALAFLDGGLYVIADFRPYSQTLVVDAGPQGVGRSGHGHADALSLRLTMDGRRCLVDSGSGVYISKDPADRNIFRGTGAHNTLRIDELDQAVPDEPFSWTDIPTTQVENWVIGKTFTYFVGSHDGYSRLADPVVHRRHVMKIAGDLFLVRDVAVGRAEHELEMRWHFAPDLDVTLVRPGRVEIAGTNSGARETGLSLIVPENTLWQAATEVSRTVLSPAYGALQAAPLVRCQVRVALPAETATALVPRQNAVKTRSLAEPRLTSISQAGMQLYELDYHDRSDAFFFALREEAWSFGPWSSDAQMLYCGIDEERLSHLVMIGGTHITWRGQPLLNATTPLAFFEWRKQDAVMHGTPGEFTPTPLFEQLTGTEFLNGATGASVSQDHSSYPYAEKH